jgi:ABC-2 type transport system ATP-binding protein
MNEEKINKRIDEFARFFKFTEHIHRQMAEFSKGTKQKVVISAALIHSPKVIFLDEPLSGLDANTALLLKKLLQRLSKEGRTIFYCSHILEVVEALCDRIIIIDKGQLIADGSVEQLKEMTKQSSLEGVFRKLTRAEDVDEVVNEFTKTISDT